MQSRFQIILMGGIEGCEKIYGGGLYFRVLLHFYDLFFAKYFEGVHEKHCLGFAVALKINFKIVWKF